MNRVATTSHRRAAPFASASPNQTDDGQKRIQELIQRFHTGRWPLFRCLGIRQHGGVVLEAVEWLRMRPRLFAVVKYHPDGRGLSWKRHKSRKSALAALSEACQTT